jgi:hypothetical protein
MGPGRRASLGRFPLTGDIHERTEIILGAYSMAGVKCPWTVLFASRFAEKHCGTAWGLEKFTWYQGPPRVAVAGNDCFYNE